MALLATQRCAHHAQREAVARCPACNRYFCRECVTEHEGRVLCAACLYQLLHMSPHRRHGWRWSVRCLWSIGSFVMLWLLLYWLGQALLTIPDVFHQGMFGHDNSGESP